ncbi:hypothetical protein SERLA73DRAFT_76847 [Serpula lacrymans var. lacrymans S7.3]|uniref:Uncharacterized protein n=1 Tax=Serpula lacrymans var. lacrymans (strain S7.3) TaxID=936435 RepID=F8Q898_SERL3|nr:hypothetical protein SERLA73DRAFT_76847 [Serpula lacrymans var. lacrymans S7.3]
MDCARSLRVISFDPGCALAYIQAFTGLVRSSSPPHHPHPHLTGGHPYAQPWARDVVTSPPYIIHHTDTASLRAHVYQFLLASVATVPSWACDWGAINLYQLTFGNLPRTCCPVTHADSFIFLRRGTDDNLASFSERTRNEGGMTHVLCVARDVSALHRLCATDTINPDGRAYSHTPYQIPGNPPGSHKKWYHNSSTPFSVSNLDISRSWAHPRSRSQTKLSSPNSRQVNPK